MAFTRRQFVAAAALTAAARAQDRTASGPKRRTNPSLCLFSEQFKQVGYDELGGMLRTFGFDGCVISIGPGTRVVPETADLHLMRFIEAVTGVGLDVPAIATPLTSPNSQAVRLAFAVGREMGVPILRPGPWRYGAAPNLDGRFTEIQRDVLGFASLGSQTAMAIALHNGAGDMFGAGIWDIQAAIRNIDPRFAGYDFDIAYATTAGGADGAAVALRLALPRLKMVTARDCYWAKEAGAWKLKQCPLGEGMVDWPRFFGALAGVRFAGPIALFVEYQPADELSAVRQDLEFLKKHRAAAFG